MKRKEWGETLGSSADIWKQTTRISNSRRRVWHIMTAKVLSLWSGQGKDLELKLVPLTHDVRVFTALWQYTTYAGRERAPEEDAAAVPCSYSDCTCLMWDSISTAVSSLVPTLNQSAGVAGRVKVMAVTMVATHQWENGKGCDGWVTDYGIAPFEIHLPSTVCL